MVDSSGSASTSIPLQSPASWRLLECVVDFLIRRRILLSGILFALLVAQDVAFGFKPRDLVDWREPWVTGGWSLIAGGLALRSWAVGILRKDRELTTTGPYSLIRNPLYVGSFLMMFGFCALIDDPKNIWFILGPVLLVYVLKVRREERLLASLFPHEWPAYALATPRFFPRWPRRYRAAQWRASQWISSREYQAPLATLMALAAMKVWQMS